MNDSSPDSPFTAASYVVAWSQAGRASNELTVVAEDAALLAIVREEKWPEIHDRDWPDGLRNLPWLPWLLGVGRSTPAVRSVVRRASDQKVILRLHHRQPIFKETVGLFDARDERIGYWASAFKGSLESRLGFFNTQHAELATTRGHDRNVFALASRYGGDDAFLKLTRHPETGGVEAVHVTSSPWWEEEAPRRLWLLSAAIVVCQTFQPPRKA